MKNTIKDAGQDRIFNIVNAVIIITTTLVVLYPLVLIISASISNPLYLLKGQIWLFPKGITFESYGRVFKNEEILTGYKNTILYTVTGTLISVVLTILAAYPLSKKNLYGRGAVTGLITLTMFFHGGLIPTYLVIKQLNMINTFFVMVIPAAISVWNVIIMRTYFQNSIPDSIEESAYMDGATHFKTLLQIVLPMSTPIISVMVLFYSVGIWNSYFNALIYLTDTNRYPLQLIIRKILVQNSLNDMIDVSSDSNAEQILIGESIKYSVIVVSMLPMLILYPFLQKYFQKGIMIGALKG